jgi:hypothetical protein
MTDFATKAREIVEAYLPFGYYPEALVPAITAALEEAARAEREACAKIVGGFFRTVTTTRDHTIQDQYARAIEAAIREQKGNMKWDMGL